MNPSYKDWQLVLVDKRKQQYTYNDVIVFWADSLSAYCVKRIVACPNDHLVFSKGMLYVNGTISEVYPHDGLFTFEGAKDVTLHDGQYYVIGDNISHSIDSRNEQIGPVFEESILGIVCK